MDSKSVYFLTDLNSEFNYLKKYNIESKQVELVQKENWDKVSSFFSDNATYRISIINDDTQTKIKIFDIKNYNLLIETNLKGTLYCIEKLQEYMGNRKSGHISIFCAPIFSG